MVDNRKTIFELFEEDPARTGVRLATFMGANMMVLNVAKSVMPGRYGAFRRLVYLLGALGVSLYVSDKAELKIADHYDALFSKKYKPHNEADDNTPTDKEEENHGEDTENSETIS